MFKKNYSITKEPIAKLSISDLHAVTGGKIFEKSGYYLVINTSGMSMVRSKVEWGENKKFKTKEEAFAEAQRLDAINHSIK